MSAKFVTGRIHGAIAKFVAENQQKLKADVALVSDTEMFAPELPTLCVGLRGMVYTEIEARGARQQRLNRDRAQVIGADR